MCTYYINLRDTFGTRVEPSGYSSKQRWLVPLSLSWPFCFLFVEAAGVATDLFPYKGAQNTRQDMKINFVTSSSLCARHTTNQVQARHFKAQAQCRFRVQASHPSTATTLVSQPCHMLHKSRASLKHRMHSTRVGVATDLFPYQNTRQDMKINFVT